MTWSAIHWHFIVFACCRDENFWPSQQRPAWRPSCSRSSTGRPPSWRSTSTTGTPRKTSTSTRWGNEKTNHYTQWQRSKLLIGIQKVVRDTKQTLLFLLFLYCPSVSPKVVLKRKDLGKEVGGGKLSSAKFSKWWKGWWNIVIKYRVWKILKKKGGERGGQQRKYCTDGIVSGGPRFLRLHQPKILHHSYKFYITFIKLTFPEIALS